MEAKVLKIDGELACSAQRCNLCSGSAWNDACQRLGGTACSLQPFLGV